MSKSNYSMSEIANSTRTYYEGVNQKNDLTEKALYSLNKFENVVMVPYHAGRLNSSFITAIDAGKKLYFDEHPEKVNISNDLTRTAEMQAVHGEDGPVRALVKKEEGPFPLKKTGFINLAILLYGTLNIGIILAIALMK